jgi:hypothetical protein
LVCFAVAVVRLKWRCFFQVVRRVNVKSREAL